MSALRRGLCFILSFLLLRRQQAMSDLQTLVTDLERKNGELKKSVDGVRNSVEEKLLSPRHSSPSPPRLVYEFLDMKFWYKC